MVRKPHVQRSVVRATRAERKPDDAPTLAQFFVRSPLRGSRVKIERVKDPARKLDL
jgi:hypothetical protein